MIDILSPAILPGEINRLLAGHGFEREPLYLAAGVVRARHEDWSFSSVFQPLFRLHERELLPFAFEALARVRDTNGNSVAPAVLFAAETSPRRSVFLDRLLRCLHLLNFLRSRADPGLLLTLNVNAQHLVNVSESHGRFFAEVLSGLDVQPQRICLEIVEDAVDDPMRLLQAVTRYRELGFGIALDDFGQGASNLERVWLLEPDYVKLDRRLMRQALMLPSTREPLAKLVAILHLHGAQVVAEGIESALQLDIARDCDCDFAQGYFLGRPAAAPAAV
ncbi:EAL domain-containing protein [Paludibacterium yongneupense]|uniref:EAL domain-containing protein n=1 Tax=Paludibacterium yongneupense TaxID=400061 RepID=UPI000418AD82|nr:EAL domain-containing protein [Paludibacterium yongneupense]